MQGKSQIQRIEECGVIAIVRSNRAEDLMDVARAIARGGVQVIEFTMTTPNALDILVSSRKEFKDDILLGAGTILDAETARAAILSGAEFIVSPNLRQNVIEMCRRYSVAVIPGAYTPTEILTAWEYGADMVKLFPAENGGAAFLKAVKAPLPQVKLVPVGGISLDNVSDFIKAGASAIAVGSNLVDKKLVAEKQYDRLAELASQFITAVRDARTIDREPA